MKLTFVKPFIFLLCIFSTFFCRAQKKKQANDALKKEAIAAIQLKYEEYRYTALEIWNYAEVGYKEEKSTALLQQTLSDNGFIIKKVIAGKPTEFIATYGSGHPVIAILAEFDALPGLSQEAVGEKKSIPNKAAGQGCGHHLFGTASVAACIEI